MREQLGGRYHLVHQLHALGLLQPDLITLEQEPQRVGRRQHAGDALRPAGARKQPHLDLRKPHAGARVARRDAVVAGEAKLEAAAERSARDRRHPRLAAGLDPPIDEREPAALLEQAGDVGILTAPRARALRRTGGSLAAERLQHGEVGPGAERVLAGGDDRALDRAVGRHPLDDIGELGDDRAGR